MATHIVSEAGRHSGAGQKVDPGARLLGVVLLIAALIGIAVVLGQAAGAVPAPVTVMAPGPAPSSGDTYVGVETAFR